MRRLGSAAVGVIVFVAAHGAAGPPCCAAPAVAGASRQAAEAYRLTVGDAQVVSFSDCTIPIDLHKTLSGITRSELDALLAAAFASNPMETSVNVFLIRWAGRTVLVDTGLGDPSRADCGRIFEGLAAVGIRPSQIDDVLITHLHLDHVGGLLRNGAMTFPNATIHISKPELDSYLYPTAGQDVRAHDLSRLIVSIVKPYLDAGRIKTFAQSGEILPGLSARILPGHTAGSTVYTLTISGQELVFIGDYNPVAVVGFRDPGVTFATDQDREKTRAVRLQLLTDLARSGALVAAPHLDFPGIGHVGVEGAGYRWFPIDYSNRKSDLPAVKF